jgi:predicted AAA+ superfamily ATPase
VDLVERRGNEVSRLVQVAWSLAGSGTTRRELAALDEAGCRFPDAERILVVGEEGADDTPSGSGVSVVPFWRFIRTDRLGRLSRE